MRDSVDARPLRSTCPPDTLIGQEMLELMTELYPLCRSITGDGVRETLAVLRRRIALEVHEVASGSSVFDWTVPKEWSIRDAYIKDSRGDRLVDFQKSNLHVVGYSVPVSGRMRFAELRPHLFTLPERPDWIPYRTSYYRESWGFCLSENQLKSMNESEEYDVRIDSSLAVGHLTYGEFTLKGETADEVLVSCHVCHPSLCNDNLSGVSMAACLAKYLAGARRLRYTYRFVFVPATIGAIAWLSVNQADISRIKHGLVLALVGDRGKSTYKRSRRGNAEIDRAVAHVLKHSGDEFEIREFSPHGYDERQYCSPGFNLPVGCLMRTPNGEFPEYHTSADNLQFVQAEAMADSFIKCWHVIEVLEGNGTYLNLNPYGEPQLGKRGLYSGLNQQEAELDPTAIFWVLNLSDGGHSLLDISERAGIGFERIRLVADALVSHKLLKDAGSSGGV